MFLRCSRAPATNAIQLVKQWWHCASSVPILFVFERQEALMAGFAAHLGETRPVGVLLASTPVSNARLEVYICRKRQAQSNLSIAVLREITCVDIDPDERRTGGLDDLQRSFGSCRDTPIVFNSEKNTFLPRVFCASLKDFDSPGDRLLFSGSLRNRSTEHADVTGAQAFRHINPLLAGVYLRRLQLGCGLAQMNAYREAVKMDFAAISSSTKSRDERCRRVRKPICGGVNPLQT